MSNHFTNKSPAGKSQHFDGILPGTLGGFPWRFVRLPELLSHQKNVLKGPSHQLSDMSGNLVTGLRMFPVKGHSVTSVFKSWLVNLPPPNVPPSEIRA